MIEKLYRYVQEFNQNDEELYPNEIPNARAFDFLKEEIPLFECPDEQFERTYYFRWWTLRKHIRNTPSGYVMTEFLPDVPWAGKYNTINCPVGHHLRESRWLRNASKYIENYYRFFLRGEGDAHKYSVWLISAIEDFHA
ncbi:MAG: hypothetical protein IJ939_04530, partial [Clostridia bacterium]|nr:hypothetical protein [Clostridia bacterium]